MNPFEMVLGIVIVVMIASVIKARYASHRGSDPAPDSAETRQLRQEVTQLKDRLAVLERITVDKENSLAREIDDLRNR